jgi:hypothetical protein
VPREVRESWCRGYIGQAPALRGVDDVVEVVVDVVVVDDVVVEVVVLDVVVDDVVEVVVDVVVDEVDYVVEVVVDVVVDEVDYVVEVVVDVVERRLRLALPRRLIGADACPEQAAAVALAVLIAGRIAVGAADVLFLRDRRRAVELSVDVAVAEERTPVRQRPAAGEDARSAPNGQDDEHRGGRESHPRSKPDESSTKPNPAPPPPCFMGRSRRASKLSSLHKRVNGLHDLARHQGDRAPRGVRDYPMRGRRRSIKTDEGKHKGWYKHND